MISFTAEFLGDNQHDVRNLQRVEEGEHQPENRFHGMGIREIFVSDLQRASSFTGCAFAK